MTGSAVNVSHVSKRKKKYRFVVSKYDNKMKRIMPDRKEVTPSSTDNRIYKTVNTSRKRKKKTSTKERRNHGDFTWRSINDFLYPLNFPLVES